MAGKSAAEGGGENGRSANGMEKGAQAAAPLTRRSWTNDDLAIVKDCAAQGWGYRRISSEYGKRKGWGLESIKRLFRRAKTNKGFERKSGQGKKLSKKREDWAEKLGPALKQDPGNQDAPVNKISKMERVPRRTVRRVLRKDLKLVSRKKVKGQRLGGVTK